MSIRAGYIIGGGKFSDEVIVLRGDELNRLAALFGVRRRRLETDRRLRARTRFVIVRVFHEAPPSPWYVRAFLRWLLGKATP